MIIWGTKNKIIQALFVKTECSHCQHDELIYTTMQNFFTLFFIPTIPLKKHSYFVCENCGSEFPDHLFKFEEPVETKTPWWGFSGSFVFGSLILLAATFGYLDSEKNKEYLANPHVGDTLVINLKDDQKTPYIFIKVTGIEKEYIAAKQSQYSYSRSRDASAALHSKNSEDKKYLPDIYEIPVQEFKAFDVVSIDRKD